MQRKPYPSEYCTILPFFDQAIQFKPGSTLSLFFKTRMTLGVSAVAGFDTLQTRRSPSEVCVASISDFCLVDEACHAKLTIGEGARDVDNVCKMVKEGCKATSSMDPFMYLVTRLTRPSTKVHKDFANPIAYVWQSLAGAMALMGSKIVRADTCSDVPGSKRMTLP